MPDNKHSKKEQLRLLILRVSLAVCLCLNFICDKFVLNKRDF